MKPLRVIVGCEVSGEVRRAFRALGHDAWSCDLQPAEDGGEHVQCNVLDLLDGPLEGGEWDLGIFHPPCTRLANSGVLRIYRDGRGENGLDPSKWAEMKAGCELFSALWHAPIPHVCIENPVQHGHAIMELLQLGVPRFSQTLQPFEHGEPESKRTCLWLRGLPLLQPATTQAPDLFLTELPKPDCGHWDNQCPSGQNKLGPSPERAAIRARTYPGIARAMAQQWSKWLLRSELP